MTTNYKPRFKLHLCPPNLRPPDIENNTLPLLPPNKTVVDIYADMLCYLFKCAKAYILSKSTGDSDSLTTLFGRCEIVLSHPNGWGGPQQAQMRAAAVLAGLISDNTEDQDRLQFVTEGEASLHFCISHASASDGIMVASFDLL
jgi:hypothetical protein